jgi:DNA-binding NarL/FixJ family response regulator
MSLPESDCRGIPHQRRRRTLVGMADRRVVTLLLVDNHTVIRRGLRMRLELEPDLRILGEASDGEDALDLAARLDTDVVVVSVPGLEHLGALRALTLAAPRSRLVVVTPHETNGRARLAAALGVVGLVSKHDSPEALLAAIRAEASREAASPPLPYAWKSHADPGSATPTRAQTDTPSGACMAGHTPASRLGIG